MIELTIFYKSLFFIFLAFINLLAYIYGKATWFLMFMCGFTLSLGLGILISSIK